MKYPESLKKELIVLTNYNCTYKLYLPENKCGSLYFRKTFFVSMTCPLTKVTKILYAAV